jgi:tight adherence protein B
MNQLLPAVLVFTTAALGTVTLVMLFDAFRGARQRRTLVERLEELEKDLATNSTAATGGLLRSDVPLPRIVQVLIARVPRLKDLGLILEQSNLGWSMQTFLIFTLVGGAALALLAILLGQAMPFVAIFAVIGAALPNFHVRRARTKRFRAFEEQIPEAVDLMGRALRAGHPFSAGIKMVADEMKDPIGLEFRRVYDQHRFGLALPDALLSLADRVDLVDLRLFVTAVLIQRDVGGNLAEILDKIAYTTRERFKIRRQIRVHTAQGRMTGYLLSILPIATGFAFLMISRDYVLTLVRDPVGHMILGTIFVLQILGFLWIRKLVDIEY